MVLPSEARLAVGIRRFPAVEGVERARTRGVRRLFRRAGHVGTNAEIRPEGFQGVRIVINSRAGGPLLVGACLGWQLEDLPDPLQAGDGFGVRAQAQAQRVGEAAHWSSPEKVERWGVEVMWV